MKCPMCNKPVAREGNPHRPFCSERCKLLDFGAWVNEEYGVPSDEAPVFEETPPGHPAPGDSSDRAPNS